MIVQVLDVNPSKTSATVIMQGSSGTRRIPDVKLTHRCNPEVNDYILVIQDGNQLYGIDRTDEETPQAEEARANAEYVPGDDIMGDPENGTGIAVRKGGLISIIAEKVVGVVLSKVNGLLQLFGKSINLDTDFFHWRARTLSDGANSRVELSVFGSPLSSPLSTEMVKATLDTLLAQGALDIAGLQNININLNIAPQTGVVVGPNLNFNISTPQGKVEVKVNGVTGVLEVSSPTLLKIDAPLVMINSDGNPLDRVLTAKTISPYTGNIMGQGSTKVYVG